MSFVLRELTFTTVLILSERSSQKYYSDGTLIITSKLFDKLNCSTERTPTIRDLNNLNESLRGSQK